MGNNTGVRPMTHGKKYYRTVHDPWEIIVAYGVGLRLVRSLYIKGLKQLVRLCSQAGWLVRFTTISLIPTPQVKRVSSFQQSPVEFAEDYMALFRCAVEGVSVKTSNLFSCSLMHLYRVLKMMYLVPYSSLWLIRYGVFLVNADKIKGQLNSQGWLCLGCLLLALYPLRWFGLSA
jgi:hypothetical protein